MINIFRLITIITVTAFSFILGVTVGQNGMARPICEDNSYYYNNLCYDFRKPRANNPEVLNVGPSESTPANLQPSISPQVTVNGANL